jgi:hypothetical protein
MMAIPRRIFLAGLIVLVSACSSPPTPQEQAEAQETAQLSPLKSHYPDVVMGFDIHGPRVDVSIDSNGLISMDEDKEDAMKAEALKLWRDAWRAAHPHEHANLTVRLIDFQGNPQFTETTRA